MATNIIVYKAIDDEGNSYWPEMFPVTYLYSLRSDPIAFASQYQSSPIDLSGNFLKQEWLSYYNWNELPERFERIIAFIDPAISQATTADFFALAVGGLFQKQVYLLDLVKTRAPLQQQESIITGIKTFWNVDEICIEATGQQLYLVNYLTDRSINVVTPQKEWSRANKDTKFSTLAAHFNSRRIMLPATRDEDNNFITLPRFNAFIDEWISYPTGLHDDTLDAIAGVASRLISGPPGFALIEPLGDALVTFITDNAKKRRQLTTDERMIIERYEAEGLYSVRREGYQRIMDGQPYQRDRPLRNLDFS